MATILKLLTQHIGTSMRDHPIPPVTEPLQYRAIGVVRGIFTPNNDDQLNRGKIVDDRGDHIETVVLGRVLTLMKHHIDMKEPHLWVVYPRCKDFEHLHLQIAGIWEPSTLKSDLEDINDILPEGDDYFSIRGELVYTKSQNEEMVVKVRQRPKKDGNRPLPFKIQIKGKIPINHLRHFVSLQVRRHSQELHLENFEIVAPIPTRGGKTKGGRKKKVIAEQVRI